MSEKIEPALTAEEWANGQYIGADLSIRRRNDGLSGHRLELDVRATPFDTPEDFAAAVAMFNAALPGDDPRKITRERIEALRRCVELARESEMGTRGGVDWRRDTFADSTILALESYLPPEGV